MSFKGQELALSLSQIKNMQLCLSGERTSGSTASKLKFSKDQDSRTVTSNFSPKSRNKFREYWDKVNHDYDVVEIKKKTAIVQSAFEERRLLSDKRKRELAEREVEKQRMQKMAQMVSEQNAKMNQINQLNVANGKHEIRLALDEQLKLKRNKILEERRKQRVLTSSRNNNASASQNVGEIGSNFN